MGETDNAGENQPEQGRRWYHWILTPVAVIMFCIPELGICGFFGMLWWSDHELSKPATQQELAEFERVYGFKITREETEPGFQHNPDVYRLRKNKVTSVLWSFVSSAYQKDLDVESLNKQREAWLQQTPNDDWDVKKLQGKIVEVDNKIATAKNEREAIQKSWKHAQRLSIRCKFGDGGTSDFELAVIKYKDWKTQHPDRTPIRFFYSFNPHT